VLGDKDQSLAALFYSFLDWNSPSPRVGSGELRTLSLRSERAACSTDLWVAGREMKGHIASCGPPSVLNPGLVGGRESLVYPRLDRLPGSPTAPSIPAAPIP